jgi:hypothetical protein
VYNSFIMKHKHHIIPRHMGGTDDPSNLMEVTIEEHAELHLALYLEYGKIEDWIACNMLSGQTEEGERSRRILVSDYMKNRVITQEVRNNMSIGQRQRFSVPGSRIPTPAMIEYHKRSSGEGNHFYGKTHNEETREVLREKAKEQWRRTKYVWINNGKVSRRVSEDNIPDGFVRGRLKTYK